MAEYALRHCAHAQRVVRVRVNSAHLSQGHCHHGVVRHINDTAWAQYYRDEGEHRSLACPGPGVHEVQEGVSTVGV